MPACDNCRTAAYDLDPAYFVSLPREDSANEMDHIATLMGADLPDHICDLVEDPECGLSCDCACRPLSPLAPKPYTPAIPAPTASH